MSNLKLVKAIPNKSYGETTSAPFRLASISGIDATALGTTNLYTVPTGESVVILEVIVRCTAAANVTTPAKANVGVSSGDIFASQYLTGLTTTGLEFTFPNGGIGVVVAAASIIKFEIDVAALGSTPSQTFTVDLIGYGI